MKNLIMNYAQKNPEFNQVLKNFKKTYRINDVSSEVIADISGQLLGNQEFINSLSTESPNIFKKVYNAIISLANKLTGNSKESLFLKDLKKWENAYRTQNNNLNDQTSVFKVITVQFQIKTYLTVKTYLNKQKLLRNIHILKIKIQLL